MRSEISAKKVRPLSNRPCSAAYRPASGMRSTVMTKAENCSLSMALTAKLDAPTPKAVRKVRKCDTVSVASSGFQRKEEGVRIEEHSIGEGGDWKDGTEGGAWVGDGISQGDGGWGRVVRVGDAG